MKVIYLLRHAKSSSTDKSLDDFDRPLNDRGRRAARLMGEYMAENGWSPALALCSPSARTVETLDILAAGHSGLGEIRMDEGLYLASSHHILNAVRSVEDDVAELMIVGHNPGLELLAQDLIGSGEARDIDALREKYPTAALAILDFNLDSWREIGRDLGRLRYFVKPRDLDAT